MTNYTKHSDDQLLRGLRNNEKGAFLEIFERYWYKLYKVAHSKTCSHDEAEEIVQELFVWIWDNRLSLKIKNFPVYLNIAVQRKILNTLRSKITQDKYWEYCKSFFPGEQYTTEEMVAFDELQDEIEKVVSQLPEKSRQVFHLNRVEGRSVAEIAKFLKLSERSIEYHLTKSLNQLRIHLKDFILTIFLFLGFF